MLPDASSVSIAVGGVTDRDRPKCARTLKVGDSISKVAI
jgi:hypothetical protein